MEYTTGHRTVQTIAIFSFPSLSPFCGSSKARTRGIQRSGILFTLLAITACTTPTKYTAAEIIPRVQSLPAGTEKRIALAVLTHPDTNQYIDRHGYPAWRWRGADDIGACVHIDPKTEKPYLETQFPRSHQSEAPKYIDFGTDGRDWQCRIHIHHGLLEYEKNWPGVQCHREGKELLKLLSEAL